MKNISTLEITIKQGVKMEKVGGESYLKEVSSLIFFFPYAWSI
jgi:hypothetical protein